jgi:hypothetical protein
MKSLAAASLALASIAAAVSVEVSNWTVHKHEDPITQKITVRSISFTLNGYLADNVECSFTDLPTFPSDIFSCSDSNNSGYRFVLHEGAEGSGIQFGLSLYQKGESRYVSRSTVMEDSDDANCNTRLGKAGEDNVIGLCTPDNDDYTFEYTCKQLMPLTIDLKEIL